MLQPTGKSSRRKKQYAIIDRCVLQQATPEDMNRLNQKYAFVFPIVLLMECAMSNNRRIIENIERIEDFFNNFNIQCPDTT